MERLRKIGFSKLTLLEDALKNLAPHVKELSWEEIEAQDALNRILSEDLKSKINVPPFDRAAMDGYAIVAEDSYGASPKTPKIVKLTGTIEIGQDSDLTLNNGEAIKISTGATIPKGASAVVKIEDTEINGNQITLYNALVPGKNISKAGEDIKKGNKILEKGTQLKPEHIALISSLGQSRVKVRKKPRITLIASGDELLNPGDPISPGKIYDSNTSMITGLISIYGANLVKSERIRDNEQELSNGLNGAIEESDIIIFTGGTSVGTKDYLPKIIENNGKILTHGIAMRPGSPVLIGIISECVVFCLPGTPVAAYLGFIDLVGPTIKRMMKANNIDPRIIIKAKMTKDVPVSGLGFLNHLRVKVIQNNTSFEAVPIKLKGSGVISSLTESDGIVEILPFQEGLKKGDNVFVKLHPT